MSLAILFHLLYSQHVSLCAGDLVWLVLSGARVAGFSLQHEHHQIPAAPKAPTHNELRTRRPMW